MKRYYQYLRKVAGEKLKVFIDAEGISVRNIFSQAALNRFLQELEHNTESENKITTGGNYKEPNIFFDWTDKTRTDITINGKIQKQDFVSSKSILQFLGMPKNSPEGKGGTGKPKQKTVLMTARLFEAKSLVEFTGNKVLEINKVNANAVRLHEKQHEERRKSWYSWKIAITREDDTEKQYEMYRQALAEFPESDVLMHSFAQLNIEFGNMDVAKKYFIKALELNPNEPNYNTNYGLFLHQEGRDFDLAEHHFKKAAKLNPKHIRNSAHYAWFLHTVRAKYDLAEHYYKLALKINPEDFVALNNYAMLLQCIRFNVTKAEELFTRALALNPFGADVRGNYATLLTQWNIDLNLAEKFFKAALDLEPTCAFKNANYAQLLFIQNRVKEALLRIEKAKQYLGNDIVLLLEMSFYLFAHCSDKIKAAEKDIKSLLKKGVRSTGWNFSQNIKTAIKNSHPFPKKLLEYASQISECGYYEDGSRKIE